MNEILKKEQEEFSRKFKKYSNPTAISTFDGMLMASEFEDFLHASNLRAAKAVLNELTREGWPEEIPSICSRHQQYSTNCNICDATRLYNIAVHEANQRLEQVRKEMGI